MNTIYVGDSKNIIKRICNDHCKGNVEASALRKHIAERKGYELKKEKRNSGSSRIRLNLPDPQIGENEISAYLKSGFWKYILCESYNEAHDFQYYVIDQLSPKLNRDRKNWNIHNNKRYEKLFNKLIKEESIDFSHLVNHPTGPGVYVFYHIKES